VPVTPVFNPIVTPIAPVFNPIVTPISPPVMVPPVVTPVTPVAPAGLPAESTLTADQRKCFGGVYVYSGCCTTGLATNGNSCWTAQYTKTACCPSGTPENPSRRSGRTSQLQEASDSSSLLPALAACSGFIVLSALVATTWMVAGARTRKQMQLQRQLCTGNDMACQTEN
jgi:hypothetical protein